MGEMYWDNMVADESDGREKQLQYVLHLLSSEEPHMRWKAAEALGRLEDQRAVVPLIHALDDSDWRVRQKAAWALGNIGDPQAIPALKKRSTDQYEGVQDMARQATENILRKMSF